MTATPSDADDRDDARTSELRPNPPVRHYANWFTPEIGAYDLALHFAYNRASPPDPEWLVTVVLSWEEVVTVRDILNTQIALYEEHAGDIRRWEGPPPVIDADSNGSPESDRDDEDDDEDDD